MEKGIIRYDKDGLPICEICGGSFDRLLAHVRQKHFIAAREYKITYGLDVKKGITSRRSAEKSRQAVMENYDKVVGENLLKGGEGSRFEKGSKGRTRDQVSEQTRKVLSERLKNQSINFKRESGKKLGKSGLGNKKRWNKQ